MRTIIWYIHFTVTLLLTSPKMLSAKKQKETMPKNEFMEAAYKYVSAWALKQIKMSGGRFHIAGEDNIPKDEAVLFVSNHQSNFDIAIFLCLIPYPKAFIAKIEILKVPILRTWMKLINCVFMDRSDIKKSAQAILDGINILKSGQSMVVYPEGTRSKSGAMGEFKAGSFKLATKAKVAIVPVSISGSYKIMEGNGGKIKPDDVYITIHPAVPTANLSPEELQELPGKVYEIIKSKI